MARIVRLGIAACLVAALCIPAALAREEKVSLEGVPGVVMAKVTARFPGATVKGAARETEKGQPVYEITLEEKGRNVDVILTPAGELLLIERAIDEGQLPEPVRRALAQGYPDATFRVVEEIVEVDKGQEHLAFYEVELLTNDRQVKEVKLRPDGGGLTEEIEEEGGRGDDEDGEPS